MKKLIILTMLISTITVAQTKMDNLITEQKQEYVLPCVTAITTGLLLNSKQGLSIGSSVCAGVVTYAYLRENTDGSDSELRTDFEKLAKQVKKDIKDNHEIAKENYSAYRDAIRKIVVKEFNHYNREFLKNAKTYSEFKKLKENNSSKIPSEKEIVKKVIDKIKEEVR